MLTPVEPPRIRIEISSCQREGAHGPWLVTWSVHNDGTEPLRLEEAWIPHGRFRGEGRLALDSVVQPGKSIALSLRVLSDEAPGTMVENAFLILRATAGGEAWRLFARMRVGFDADGRAAPVVESMTAQSLQSE
jgi:hypothetical protein